MPRASQKQTSPQKVFQLPVTTGFPTVLPHQIAVAHQVNGLRPITTSGPFAKTHPQNPVEAVSISLANAWMEDMEDIQ